MGPLREAGRDRGWRGGAWSRSLRARLGRVSSYDLSNSPPRYPKLLASGAREARRHGSSRCRAMGPLREAARDRDWRGAAGLTLSVTLRRARGAPPRVEPLPSFG